MENEDYPWVDKYGAPHKEDPTVISIDILVFFRWLKSFFIKKREDNDNV